MDPKETKTLTRKDICTHMFFVASFSSAQLLSHVRRFATPWTAACQSSLSIANSWSLLKLVSLKLVMPSNHLILCCSLLLPPSIFPSIRSQFFTSSGQSIGVSASESVLPMNTQDWSLFRWTGWISLQSKGFSKSLLQHHSSKASVLRYSFSL